MRKGFFWTGITLIGLELLGLIIFGAIVYITQLDNLRMILGWVAIGILNIMALAFIMLGAFTGDKSKKQEYDY